MIIPRKAGIRQAIPGDCVFHILVKPFPKSRAVENDLTGFTPLEPVLFLDATFLLF